LWAKSERRTDNKISYQCGTLIRNSIIRVAHTDNRFYARLALLSVWATLIRNFNIGVAHTDNSFNAMGLL